MEAPGALPADRAALVERFATFPARLADAARAAEGRPVPGRGVDAGPGRAPPDGGRGRGLVVAPGRRSSPAASRTGRGPSPARCPASTTRRWIDVLGLFGRLRASTVDFLGMFDDAAWARTGVHATYGRLDVAGLLRLAIDHDEEHVAGLLAPAPKP